MPSFGLSSNEDARKPAYKWQRVLLKVSGEALAGDNTQNIDPKVTMAIAREVASVTRLGIEVFCLLILEAYTPSRIINYPSDILPPILPKCPI